MTENALKEALVYCIVTTQTREDEVKRFDSARNTKTLWTLPVRGIQRVLERYNIRFPHKKAPWIASLRNVQVAAVIKEAVRLDDGTLRSARKVRTALRNGLGLKGMGDKQVSHLATKWLGLTPELVPLDSRWETFLKDKGFFDEDDDPKYTLLEDLVRELAKEVGVTPAFLDDAVWYAGDRKSPVEEQRNET